MTCIDFADPLDPLAQRLRGRWGAPQRVLVAHCLEAVRPVLDAAEAAARAGAWVLGWLCYEAAPAFDAALTVRPPDAQLPLAWFGVYDAPQPWPQEDAQAGASAQVLWQGGHERAAFDAALARIQQAIAAGELYQVNYTEPLLGQLQGSAAALFAALQQAQPGGYAAHIDAGAVQLLSVSPELFFDWQAGADGSGAVLTRPMKGTAARGATPDADAQQAAQLRASPKERAENVMIVDLLRNDLSRIAQPHSVRVPALFQTQQLATAWQMTSDVSAVTRPGTRLQEVFAALFPCGSVTGAPKVQAMRAIAALESGPRGVYCGAVGLLRPDGEAGMRATFNVPIRTLQLCGEQLRCGIGSGIVWGAEPDAEWREWAVKRRFVERASSPFELLETLRLEDGQYRHEPEHLARMQQAAAHFGRPWDEARVQHCLHSLAAAHPQQTWRVRLLLDVAGDVRAQAFALAATAEPVTLRLADRPLLEAESEFVRHKTTRRAHYEAFAPTAAGVFDSVLWNAAGEITEGTFGNLALLIDGRWVTPALSSGLLQGVGRAVALRQGRVQEAVVRLSDLHRVQDWAFINSLRGWLAARLV